MNTWQDSFSSLSFLVPSGWLAHPRQCGRKLQWQHRGALEGGGERADATQLLTSQVFKVNLKICSGNGMNQLKSHPRKWELFFFLMLQLCGFELSDISCRIYHLYETSSAESRKVRTSRGFSTRESKGLWTEYPIGLGWNCHCLATSDM